MGSPAISEARYWKMCERIASTSKPAYFKCGGSWWVIDSGRHLLPAEAPGTVWSLRVAVA